MEKIKKCHVSHGLKYENGKCSTKIIIKRFYGQLNDRKND